MLDTSVFIALEQGRPIGLIPDDCAISVLTLAELELGVLMSPDEATRGHRQQTLLAVETNFDAFEVTDRVGRSFAAITAEARREGRRPKVMDTLIAATASANGLPVYTQDSDFDGLRGVEAVRV